ncbi:hypothetical protein Tco_0598565 [Tanacetum coccineum]
MRHSMRMLAKDTRSQDGIDDKDNDKGSKSRSQSMKEQAYNKEQRERPRPHELNDKSNLIDLMKEVHDDEEVHDDDEIHDDEKKHDDDEIADEEKAKEEMPKLEKANKEMADGEKVDVERAKEEKGDKEKNDDDQAGKDDQAKDDQAKDDQAKDDQAKDDQVGALIFVTHKEKPELPPSTSSHYLSFDYVTPEQTTPTPTPTTPPITPPTTTEALVTPVLESDPSTTILQRLLALEEKVLELSKKSGSFLDHDKHLDLYNSLMNSISLDEAIEKGELDLAKVFKRKHDNDEDQDPLVDTGQEKKRKRRKNVEPSKKSSTSK